MYVYIYIYKIFQEKDLLIEHKNLYIFMYIYRRSFSWNFLYKNNNYILFK